MEASEILKDKVILVVDDEPDIPDTVADILNTSLITKAKEYVTACHYLMASTYNIVVLDIMGVDGFNLPKMSVIRGFPAVMLIAYALTRRRWKPPSRWVPSVFYQGRR